MLEGRGRTLVRWGLALAGLVVVVALLPQLSARLGGAAGDIPAESGGGREVRDIKAIEGLREAFNEDPGQVRMVLLLSPT